MKTITEEQLTRIMRRLEELTEIERSYVKAKDHLDDLENKLDLAQSEMGIAGAERDAAKFALGEALEAADLDVTDFFQKHIIGSITSS